MSLTHFLKAINEKLERFNENVEKFNEKLRKENKRYEAIQPVKLEQTIISSHIHGVRIRKQQIR